MKIGFEPNIQLLARNGHAYKHSNKTVIIFMYRLLHTGGETEFKTHTIQKEPMNVDKYIDNLKLKHYK